MLYLGSAGWGSAAHRFGRSALGVDAPEPAHVLAHDVLELHQGDVVTVLQPKLENHVLATEPMVWHWM